MYSIYCIALLYQAMLCFRIPFTSFSVCVDLYAINGKPGEDDHDHDDHGHDDHDYDDQ